MKFKSYIEKKYTQAELESMDIADLDKMAYGVKNGEVKKIKPSDVTVKYKADAENAEYAFKNGGMDWARSVNLKQPIDVSIDQDGKWFIEDGHHRWLAAMKTKRMVFAKFDVKGNPIKFILDRQK